MIDGFVIGIVMFAAGVCLGFVWGRIDGEVRRKMAENVEKKSG